MQLHFNLEDLSQIAIGAFALGVPISFSEEAWKLGETLPPANLGLMLLLSIAFLSFYAFEGIFQANIRQRYRVFVFRIAVAYLITGCVVALILLSIDKFPLISDPELAIRRLIVIAMPAAMGAIIVDSFDKE